MLIIKKRNIQKGFSLIELMVAVVILAIAVLGIYQAYNISFTGMADSRDRTVATNYVRQAMEGIKNMDFDKIITQSRSYITGTKYEYEREVIVQESTNLKKVTTKVYWRNRNGNKKMVENGMSVHFMQTSEGTATRIMLIANPYNVLTGGTSTITAVAKDDKGNTVTIWTGDISFTSDSGDLQPNSVSIILGNGGKASTTFTAPSDEGEVNIMASAQGLTPDSVTLKVTEPKKPVKINLTANPTYMVADTSSTSEITASIVDAGGTTVTEATNVMTFSVSGPGTLSAITSTAPTNGIAKITLTSNGTPGTITVTVSATDLEPGIVDVITGGKISLSASPSPTIVPNGEKSEITITTKDVDGVPIKYVGTINLSVEATQNSNGSGSLSIYTLDFDGSTFSNTITFTASSEGTIKITAIDQAEILDEGSIELTITEALVPDHIAVTANPSIINAGGTETSTITARVKTEYNITITGYSEVITFTTTKGTFNDDGGPTSIDLYVDENGVATVVLYPSLDAGTATIEVSSTYNTTTIYGSDVVIITLVPHHINLFSVPDSINIFGKVVDTCTITADIVDESEQTVVNYIGTVTFSIVSGSEIGQFITTGSTVVTVVNGQASLDLRSKCGTGTVVVNATSAFGDNEITSDPNLSITVTDGGTRNIELVPGTVDQHPNKKSVWFDIQVSGGDLKIYNMKITWDSSAELTAIKIDDAVVYNSGSISDGDIVDIDPTILSIGEHNIDFTFNDKVDNKNFNVIFNAQPDCGFLIQINFST